uniref:Uncharacterized protein n=1 Tax=Pantoea phage Survivor TaxID=3232176 RepID=A0AAU8L0S7_9CAUD
MNRLLCEYPDTNVNVLVNNETQLLLLLDDRHAKYEKTDVGNALLYKKGLVTNISSLRPADAVALAKPHLDLYSTDIKEIKQIDDEYIVYIHPHCLVYTGTFKIKIIK